MTFDFKKYHTRSINAHSDTERAQINEELKTLYDSLSDDDKNVFNAELQTFLSKEMGRLKSDYESIKNQDTFSDN